MQANKRPGQTSNDGTAHGVVKAEGRPLKRHKKLLNHLVQQYKLNDEQEGRLGKLCGTASWLIRVAQAKGANACLAVRLIVTSQLKHNEWTLNVETGDHQRLCLAFSGPWVHDAAQYFQHLGRAIDEHPFLISGLGASLQGKDGMVSFASGQVVLHILDLSEHDLGETAQLQPGWLEVTNGVISSRPIADLILDETSHSNAATTSTAAAIPTLVQCAQTVASPTVGAPSPSSVLRPSTTNAHIVSVTPAPRTSIALSETPDWLRTPIPVPGAPYDDSPLNRRVSTVESARPSLMTSGPASREQTVTRNKKSSRGNRALQVRNVGPHEITPIRLLEPSTKHWPNTIGVVASDNQCRRSQSGGQDMSLKVTVRDVYPLNGTGDSVNFMLFASDDKRLPKCKAGDIIALIYMRIQLFNGVRQGVGRSLNFGWALMDGLTSQMSQGGTSRIDSALLDEMRAQHAALYGDGEQRPLLTSAGRQLIPLSSIEPNVFFDADVEVVKIWDGRNPTIYVTDYTSHPLLCGSHDCLLSIFSKEELERRHEETNDRGCGHVLPITLWDDQQGAISQLHQNMCIRIENVRPKLAPGGYLEGNLGGSAAGFEEGKRLRMSILDSHESAKIVRQREEYVSKYGQAGSGSRRSLQGVRVCEEAGSDSLSEASVSPERALKETQVQAIFSSADDADHNADDPPQRLRTKNTVPVPKPKNGHLSRTAPIKLSSTLEGLPLTHLCDVAHFQLQPEDGNVFRFRARVILAGDVTSRNLRDWVRITCGVCQKTLAPGQAICLKCAEMDSKDLHFDYHLSLPVKDASDEEPLLPESCERSNETHTIEFAGQDAREFFHDFHPRDVREREQTQVRLAKRIAPLLGARLALDILRSCSNGAISQEAHTRGRASLEGDETPIAFDVGLEAIPNEVSSRGCNKIRVVATRLSRLPDEGELW